MFGAASSFNQPLDNWDVNSVITMDKMFLQANSFNQNIDNWDVSSVTNMSVMFSKATSFDQALDNWDVSNVTDMDRMFLSASTFNQDISGWCVEQILTEPTNFSANSPLQDSFKPDWGATCTLGIQDNELAELELYPNPTLNKVHFTIPEGMEIERIEVFNMLGQKVKEKAVIVQDDVFIDLSDLAGGNYFIQVQSRDNQQLTSRLIKQ